MMENHGITKTRHRIYLVIMAFLFLLLPAGCVYESKIMDYKKSPSANYYYIEHSHDGIYEVYDSSDIRLGEFGGEWRAKGFIAKARKSQLKDIEKNDRWVEKYDFLGLRHLNDFLSLIIVFSIVMTIWYYGVMSAIKWLHKYDTRNK